MSLQKLISNYAACNAWVNTTIIEWLKTKPATTLFEEVPSSFSSIIKTLNHIFAVEEFWYAVVAGKEIVGGRYAATEFNADEIFTGLAACSNSLAEFTAKLTEEELEQEVYIDMPWVKGQLPRYEFIQHCINHGTYHRGQIITIGRNLGFTDAPMTDYNFYNMAVLKRG